MESERRVVKSKIQNQAGGEVKRECRIRKERSQEQNLETERKRSKEQNVESERKRNKEQNVKLEITFTLEYVKDIVYL